jgi:AcrR family transcriptional regulator
MNEKIDRRIRKTKTQLRAGLAKLMQNKSINEITVKELVDEVDINRSTFYLHYTDIYNLFEEIEEDLLKEIVQVINNHPIGLNENTFSFIEDIFSILLENKDICRALIGPNGDIAFVHKIEMIIAENSMKALEPLYPTAIGDLKYSFSFCLSGSVGLIKTWILENNDESPEHMAELTYSMVINAMNAFYHTKDLVNNKH